MKYMRLSLTTCFFMASGILLAQHNEQVTVEGTYRPKVNKVDKITLTPEIPETSFSFPDADIDVKDVEHTFDIELEKLSPVGYSQRNAAAVESTENFLMVGLGTRVSPLFLYRHNSQLTRDIDLGVGLKHFSSWLKMHDFAPSSFMDNGIDVALNLKLDGYQLNNRVYYDNSMAHYYGYRLSDSILTDADLELRCPRQTYNTVGLSSTLTSTDTHLGVLQHAVGIDYRYTFDLFGAAEHYLDLNGNVNYVERWWGDKSSRQAVGADLGFIYDRYGSDFGVSSVDAYNRFIVRFNPYFGMKGGFYRLRLGVRLESIGPGSLDIRTYVTVRPDIQGSLYVFDKKVEFYSGLGGGRKLYSYRDMVGENPFVNPAIPLRFQNVKIAFDGGVRSNILERVDLHLGVRYRKIADDCFFMQLAPSEIFNSYTLVYDEVEEVRVLADLRYRFDDNINVEGHVAYNKYDTQNEEYAWYRPGFEARVKASYLLNETLGFHAAMFFGGGRYAKINLDAQDVHVTRLNPIIDLSVGADYKLSDRLSLFAKVDNLLNSKYQLYFNYPVTGLQLFVGLQAKF